MSEETLASEPGIPRELDRFNWGAFLMPPIWGVAHGQWPGVFFLPAWAFVDNVLRGERVFGVWTQVVAGAMVLATLALQYAFARNANRVAWGKSRGRVPVETFLRRQRVWAIASALLAVGMGVWIWAYIARFGMALPAK